MKIGVFNVKGGALERGASSIEELINVVGKINYFEQFQLKLNQLKDLVW